MMKNRAPTFSLLLLLSLACFNYDKLGPLGVDVSLKKRRTSVLGYPSDIVFTSTMSASSIPLVSDCFNASLLGTSCGKTLPLFQAPIESCRSFRSQDGKPKEDKLQMVHFSQAMDEECWDMAGRDYKIDHQGARNILDGCEVGIIFPRSLIAYCSCGVWNDKKNVSFYFSGINNPNRTWVKKYASEPNAEVVFTTEGRSIRKQTGAYDYNYYDKLMSSRFALAPNGVFPWTYRFLEGIMCGAIPIVPNRTSPEEQEVGYEYCEVGQPCGLLSNETLRQEAAQRNWFRFVRRHSLVLELFDEQYKKAVKTGVQMNT
jgi:hypothetical protein